MHNLAPTPEGVIEAERLDQALDGDDSRGSSRTKHNELEPNLETRTRIRRSHQIMIWAIWFAEMELDTFLHSARHCRCRGRVPGVGHKNQELSEVGVLCQAKQDGSRRVIRWPEAG